jgi:hypothetical protein
MANKLAIERVKTVGSPLATSWLAIGKAMQGRTTELTWRAIVNYLADTWQ